MKTELRTRIKGNTAAGNRVDWGLRPQGKALPAIRLTNVTPGRGYTMSGVDGLQISRVQADCYGETFKAASELGDALIALLEPKSGSFQASFVIGDRDASEITETGEIFYRQIDFQIAFISA